MSEDKGKDLGWETFSATPKIVDAVQYVVVDKEGKNYSNFLKIIKRPNINGRVSQQIDHMSVHTNDGRVQLRSGSWLVIDVVGDLHVYKDEDFQKLFETGSPVVASSTDAFVSKEAFDDGFAKLEDWKKELFEMLGKHKISIELNAKQLRELAKGAKNVKSKSSKS